MAHEADAGAPRAVQPAAVKKTPGQSPFHILKAGQGAYVRWCSAAGAGLLTLGAAALIYEKLALVTQNQVVWFIVPTIFMAVMAYLVFWLVGQNQRVVDFMIATEGELKKVNWSSRREIIGATKVVIFTVLALSLSLFVVDLIFAWFFEAVGVLKIGIFDILFGIGRDKT